MRSVQVQPLAEEDIFEIIEHIAKAEKLSVDDKAKHALVEVSEGIAEN